MSSKLLPILIIVLILILAGVVVYNNQKNNSFNTAPLIPASPNTSTTVTDAPQVTAIAEGLDTPWAIAFLPDGSMLVTERPGRVRLIDNTGRLQSQPVVTLNSVKEIGEGGLLGIALHPDFANNHFVYLYYTYSSNGSNTQNRVVRMAYTNKQLSDEQVIVDQIPGSSNHNGGRIKFGPDKYLYITTGDAENPSQAQDENTLGGKILRVTDQGQAAPGNPFNNLIYSFGHRNPQGLAWDNNGDLWETEHGPSGGTFGTGNDEINLIESGENYGWPEIQGNQAAPGMITPVRNSTPAVTWAPAGATFFNNSLFFSGLKGQTLYEAIISGGKIIDFKEHFKDQFGRLREVILGPDKMLYLTTSNRDGRGSPNQSDDRVIKINPSKF